VHRSVNIECAERYDVAPGAHFVKVQNLPEETLPFLLPNRYCESDRLTQLAQSIVAGRLPGYDQCTAIIDYIHQTLTYAPGSGQQIISACEVNEKTEAVCRDMTHLGIACCRSLSIPARIVVGYLEGLERMDLHAWFEAYVGGRWYTFDPTIVGSQGGRVAIAYGRDAADVAIYTQFGEPVDLLRMEIKVERMPAPLFE
jgi:transglutaminase-like putative cysteine protease